jgi:ribokinase
VGQDDNASVYLDACRAAKVSVDAICRSEQVRTPWCMLLHHDDGSCTCLIDRGNVDQQDLTAAQISLVRRAQLVCIAAGPAGIGAQVLETVSNGALLAWIAKSDPACFPEALARRLAQRADVIFCNASERTMVDSACTSGARAGQSIVETRGAHGVLLECAQRKTELDCEPLTVRDTTGAGDTLAGEVLASLLSGITGMEAAVRNGIEAARSLLFSRIPQ